MAQSYPKLGGWTPFKRSRPHMGPGNRIAEYPKNDKDAVYWRHDKAYARGIDRYGKVKTYLYYNQADEDLLRELGSARQLSPWSPEMLAHNVFTLKKWLAPRNRQSFESVEVERPVPLVSTRRRIPRNPYYRRSLHRRRWTDTLTVWDE